MLPPILRRLLATSPRPAEAAFAVRVPFLLMPGDPAVIIAGDYATSEDIARIRAKLGLDRPFLSQVGIWVGQVVCGDLGTSIFSGLPVSTLIGQRVGATFSLTLMAMLISVGLGVPLGIIAAWKQGSLIDRLVMIFAVSGFSMPVFWLGFLLVYVFAIAAAWLLVQGYQPVSAGVGLLLRELFLRVVAVCV